MPPEAILILIFGIFFFIILFIRAVWLAIKTGEKAFWYSSIGPLMFLFGIVSVLLGNFIGFAVMMILMLPYVTVILLKYWKRMILAQRELALKGFSPRKAMKVSDYFTLFFTMKGWLKIAEKRGKNETLVIYSFFSVLMFSIIYIGLIYAFPNILKSPITHARFLFSTVIGLVISVFFLRTYLENNQPVLSQQGSSAEAPQRVCACCGKPISFGEGWTEKENKTYHWECWRKGHDEIQVGMNE